MTAKHTSGFLPSLSGKDEENEIKGRTNRTKPKSSEKQKRASNKSKLKALRHLSVPCHFSKKMPEHGKTFSRKYGGEIMPSKSELLLPPSAESVVTNAFITPPIQTRPSLQALGMFGSDRDYKQAKHECQSIQRRLQKAKRRLLLEIAEEQNKKPSESASDTASEDPLSGGTSMVGISEDVVSNGTKKGESLELVHEEKAA